MTLVATFSHNKHSFTRFYHVSGEKYFLGIVACNYPDSGNCKNGTRYTAYHLPEPGGTPEESGKILRQYIESRERSYGKASRWRFY